MQFFVTNTQTFERKYHVQGESEVLVSPPPNRCSYGSLQGLIISGVKEYMQVMQIILTRPECKTEIRKAILQTL